MREDVPVVLAVPATFHVSTRLLAIDSPVVPFDPTRIIRLAESAIVQQESDSCVLPFFSADLPLY